MARLPRVYAVVDQETVDLLDDDAKRLEINRSQWILQAIRTYLHVKGDECIKEKAALQQQLGDTKAELIQLKNFLNDTERELNEIKGSKLSVDTEVTQLRTESEQRKTELVQASSEIAQLKLQLDQVADVKDDFDQLKKRYDQTLSEATERWQDTKLLKTETTKLKKLLEESQATNQHLRDELLKKQSETNQLATHREELAVIIAKHDSLQSALKVRDDDIAYFKSHVAQLTQTIGQLALPPSQEEARAKSGWRFWR